jgi:hypothetical protein
MKAISLVGSNKVYFPPELKQTWREPRNVTVESVKGTSANSFAKIAAKKKDPVASAINGVSRAVFVHP